MELIVQIIISGILSLALSLAAYKLRMLTFTGAMASLVVGYAVGVFGSVEWLVLLIIFTSAGLVATKMDLSNKSAHGLQEGYSGERTHKNVLGVGIPAVIFAFLYCILHTYYGSRYDLAMSIGFITTITVAAADTVASEIGIRDPKVWLITTFERVKRGTDGGVSVLGLASSAVAATFTGIIGWVLMVVMNDTLSVSMIYVAIPIAMGVLGCLLDSVIGATLERKGRISKYANNCVSAMAGAVLGVLIILFL